mmetsp:Transcript_55375/g.103915  ORF Transcript_55375/g.103915 Transcript_55375/m.103915 type:complete len:425 (+) Transcript_55375:63-1337(+)
MVRKTAVKGEEGATSPESTTAASDVSQESTPKVPKVSAATVHDPNLWYIHGNSYDLHEFVNKHPGGRMAILTGRGRDCTALFESYHPWNDKHRKVLKAYGAAPPPVDPFYEEIKEGVRKAFPGGCGSTRMRPHVFLALWALWSVMMWLFFVVRTPLSCLGAGCLVATVGTRFSHEGGHWQISKKEWVNRLCLFCGFFLVGPSLNWYYQHVVSHHVSTNQDGDKEKDVDVEHIWLADIFPGWLKALSIPGIFIGTVFELGLKRMIVDILIRGNVGGHKVDYRLGGIIFEIPAWCLFHYFFGPSTLCYLCMYLTAGAIFVPCSQVAHVILYPNSNAYDSWAKMQIAESVDFASDSDFWYHMAFGLTTQIEHHLFPGIGHHCYDTIRLITREICKKHGVHHQDVSASQAFGALWTRLVAATPTALLM